MAGLSESYEAIKALTEIDIKEFTDNVEKVEDENGAVTGTGIFDVLMNTATKHLQVQFDSGKINGELYANAYIQVYQVTLQTAKDIWLQKGISEAQLALLREQTTTEDAKRDNLNKQTDLLSEQITSEGTKRTNLSKQTDLLSEQIILEGIKGTHLNKQTDLLDKQINSEDAKRDLYRRQIEGFDEDYKQKILKIMMDSWAVGFSVSKDSFQASGIPATMQKTTIDDLYNSYIRTDFD